MKITTIKPHPCMIPLMGEKCSGIEPLHTAYFERYTRRKKGVSETKELLEEKYPVGSLFLVGPQQPEKDEFGNWEPPGWNAKMDDYIGKVLVVQSTGEMYVAGGNYAWNSKWIVPYCSCEKLDLTRSGCTCGCFQREKIKL